VLISYRSFGITYRSHLQGFDPWIYHYSLRNNPEERSSQLLRCGSLKSRMFNLLSWPWHSDLLLKSYSVPSLWSNATQNSQAVTKSVTYLRKRLASQLWDHFEITHSRNRLPRLFSRWYPTLAALQKPQIYGERQLLEDNSVYQINLPCKKGVEHYWRPPSMLPSLNLYRLKRNWIL
jgi:hypothetical protein